MSDEAQLHPVHVRPTAQRQLSEEFQRRLDFSTVSDAERWLHVLDFILEDLSKSPWCYSPARESWLFGTEVYVVLHQPDGQSAISRILFSVTEPDNETPFVTILNVRHGVPDPTKKAEARKVEDDV